MRTTFVRIANRLGIFHILVESNGPVSGKEFALETGADHVLPLRLLRYLVAMHAVSEAGIDTYIPNNVTDILAVVGMDDAMMI